MTLEVATYISELVTTNPDGSNTQVNELDDHDRLIKSVLQNTFPNANGAINPTPTEFNYLVGVTSSIQSQIDGKQAADQALTDISGLPLTDGNFIVANGTNWVAESGATARASLGFDGLSGVVQTGDIADAAVTQAKIAAAAVGQAQLKTTYGQVSTTTNLITNLPGGAYGFVELLMNTNAGNRGYGGGLEPNALSTSGSLGNPVFKTMSTASTWMCVVYLFNDDGTTYLQQRYIQASPPYDLGDGEIPRFIFVIVDSNGKVESVYQAPEAPWHYNGPTNVKADFYRNGKGYRLRRDMSAVPFTLEEAKADPAKMAEYVAAFNSAPIVEEEITQEIKNRDMPLLPHPFLGNELEGKQVVLLDPVCDLCWHLAQLCDCHDEFNLNELLHEGHIRIDNSPLNRAGPLGVPVVSFKWK